MTTPSPLSQDTLNALTQDYTGLLGRTPDAAGFKYWENQAAGGMSLTDIAAAFKASPEAQARTTTTPYTDPTNFANTPLGKQALGLGMTFNSAGVRTDSNQTAELQDAVNVYNQMNGSSLTAAQYDKIINPTTAMYRSDAPASGATTASSTGSTPATGANWKSGFTTQPITTPTPVRDFGQTGGDQWTNTIPGVGAYYVDPWGVTHSGLPMDANGNVLPADQAGQAARYWFADFPNSERTGTAALEYGWKDPAWAAQNVQQSAYTGPDGSLLGQTLPKGTQGFSVAANALSQLPDQLAQTGKQNTAYANKTGGIGGLVGTVLDVVSFFYPPVAPFAAAYNVADGLAEHNIGQAIGGALGFTGIPGGLTQGVSDALQVSGQTANAIIAAAAGGTVAGLTGGNVVMAALVSGGLQYASPAIQAQLKSMGITSQEQLVDAGNKLTPGDLETSITGPATGTTQAPGTQATGATTAAVDPQPSIYPVGAGGFNTPTPNPTPTPTPDGGIEEVNITAPKIPVPNTNDTLIQNLLTGAGAGAAGGAIASSLAGGGTTPSSGGSGTGTGTGSGTSASTGALSGIAGALGLSSADLLKLLAAGGGLLTGLSGSKSASGATGPLTDLANTETALAKDLLGKYNSGAINASDAYDIQQWQAQQLAATRQYYASAGISDSSMRVQAEGQITAQAEGMKSKALQSMLQEAINALSGAASTTNQAVTQAVAADKALSSAYASFFANLAKLGTTDTQGSTGTT